MILLWLIAGASLVLALAAWIRARRTAARLTQLSEMYWELKYQNGELRVRLEQLTGSAFPPSPQSSTVPERPKEAFVPLASLKR